MYINSAYRHNSRLDYKDKTRPLAVGSCGTYRLMTRPVLPTHRPRGRLDYQLLYVAAGKAHFFFAGEAQIVPAGNMVLYRPKEEQKYRYYGSDQTEVFWVHFTGSNVKNILRGYSIADTGRVFYTGTSPEFKRIFCQMIEELQLCRENYDELLVMLLRQIFIMMQRRILHPVKGRSRYYEKELAEAVRYCQENYSRNINIEAFASSLGMSVSWFIRSFKELTGATPAQYIRSIRIANAQSLLETTSYNITEIGGIVGYDDPLYFSRVFKKENGVSPSEFRRRLWESRP